MVEEEVEENTLGVESLTEKIYKPEIQILLHPDGPPDPRIPLVGDKTTSEGEEKVTT